MADWCEDCRGSTMGPTTPMRQLPKRRRRVEGSCRGRWPLGVSAPSFLGIHTPRSILGPMVWLMSRWGVSEQRKPWPMRLATKDTPQWYISYGRLSTPGADPEEQRMCLQMSRRSGAGAGRSAGQRFPVAK